jgi:tetratricopeptide (TPR) repeat protein
MIPQAICGCGKRVPTAVVITPSSAKGDLIPEDPGGTRSGKRVIEEIKSGDAVSLERSLLVISGLTAEQEIGDYQWKLDAIHEGYLKSFASLFPIGAPPGREHTVVFRARALFEYLWNAKPGRCDGNVLLKDVIDAQLSADPARPVGSCVGLTSLYTVLGLREGLLLTVLTNGSHVLNRLTIEERTCNIENTDSLGFDCDLPDTLFVEYPPVMLVAHVLNGRGLAREKANDLAAAEKDYTKAIHLNPAYATAHNNRGTVRFLRQDYALALADYERAVELNPDFVEAHFNCGLVKIHMARHSEAIEDFNRVLTLDGEYKDAQTCRAFALEKAEDPARVAQEQLRPLRSEHED